MKLEIKARLKRLQEWLFAALEKRAAYDATYEEEKIRQNQILLRYSSSEDSKID